MDDLESKIIELMDLFDGEVTTADKIDRPERALEKEAIDDFNKRNPMAGGGMLVSPSADGSRPGYAEKRIDKLEQRQKAYEKFLKETDYLGTDKEFEKIQEDAITKKTGSGVKPPSVQARFKKVTKYLEKLIPKLNAEDRFYTKDEVSAMVEKKFNIKTRRNEFGFKINQFLNRDYPIMRTLDKSDVKLENLIGKMLMEDKPLNDFFLKSLQKRLNLGERVVSDLIKQSTFFNTLKDSGIDALVYSFNREKPHGFLKKLSLSDQLKTALEMEQGLPRYTDISGEDVRARSPKFTVMDFAKRSWNQNKGKGAIQFFDKNGKLINWSFNLQLPYNQVSFKYNGKKYSSKILNNTLLLKKNFPEVYENQMALNKLKNTRITDPLNKNKTITVANLVKRNQIKNYNWSPDKSSFDILHSTKGVKNEPFTNLSFNTSDINTIERGITESAVLNKNQKNKIIKNIDKVYGSGDPDAITKRQINLAKSKKIISYESMRDDVLKQIARLSPDPSCSVFKTVRVPKSDGGDFAKLNSCVAGGVKAINEGKIPNEKATDFLKLLKGGSNAVRNVAKYGVLPEAFLFTADTLARTALGDTWKEAGLRASDYLLPGDQTKEADIAKVSRVFNDRTGELVGKSIDYKNTVNRINSLEAQRENLETTNVPSDFGYFDSSSDIKNLDANIAQAKKDLENKFFVPLEQRLFADRKLDEAYDESMAASDTMKKLGAVRETAEAMEDTDDFSGLQSDAQAPTPLNLDPSLLPNFRKDMEIAKTLGSVSAEEARKYFEGRGESPDEFLSFQESFKNLKDLPLSNLAQLYGDEQIYGTQGASALGEPLAEGGIAGLSGGDKSGPPPQRGPNSEGLSSLLKRGTNT